MDNFSYALGMNMGNNFTHMGIKDINVQDFVDGMSAVLYGSELKLTYQQAKAVVDQYFINLQKQQEEENKKMGEMNAATGKAFLDENGKRTEVKTTASGLQYEVLEQGEGPHPTPKDQVTVHYTGKLLDGTVFDSSVERGEPATFGVTQVIPGWVEALQLMQPGAKYRLYIPSDLAYGPNGAGGLIGPNQTLIFDVELISIA